MGAQLAGRLVQVSILCCVQPVNGRRLRYVWRFRCHMFSRLATSAETAQRLRFPQRHRSKEVNCCTPWRGRRGACGVHHRRPASSTLLRLCSPHNCAPAHAGSAAMVADCCARGQPAAARAAAARAAARLTRSNSCATRPACLTSSSILHRPLSLMMPQVRKLSPLPCACRCRSNNPCRVPDAACRSPPLPGSSTQQRRWRSRPAQPSAPPRPAAVAGAVGRAARQL